MTQLFNLTIDATLQTVAKVSISEEMNRMYDVAKFNMETEPEHELEVIINYGDKTFTGFVYATRKVGINTYSVECRTYGAMLTEPYSAYTEGFDDATTSHALCALYATASGLSITITAGDFGFGGSYERTGTMLSALQNIANVTGAEYWDDGTGIQIQPNKAILEADINTMTEIAPADIFDFVASKRTVYNKGVGFVTIQNGGSTTTDIISRNKIYAEIDECSGEIFVYPNPNGTLEYTKGLSSLSSVTVERQETNSLLDNDLIALDGAIQSISEVTLNGNTISNYNFVQGHNVIYFSTLQRGTLTVSYKAYAKAGYCDITEVPLGRFITFDAFYLDQMLRFEGLLSPDCDNTSKTDGDMTCIVPADMYYNAGFTVWTIGGDPEFIFYSGTTVIVRNVVSTLSTYTAVESARLEEFDSGYRYKTRHPIEAALGARANGVDISYTTSVDGDDYYFEFTEFFPAVTVSYEAVATNHYIQFPTIPHADVAMLIRNNNTGKVCEYQLETKIPCVLNQYIDINVAGELGLEVTDVRGATLSYTKPNTSSGSVVVDAFGYIKIWVFMDGDYVIDTSALKPRTFITLTANVNG